MTNSDLSEIELTIEAFIVKLIVSSVVVKAVVLTTTNTQTEISV